MLKLVGLCMVALFCTLYGWLRIRRLHSGVLQCEGMRQLLECLRNRIGCYCSPLHEIYADFHNGPLEECGFVSMLRKYGFLYAIENCTGLCMPSDIRELLLRFGGMLGESGKEEQLSHCSYYIGELDRLLFEMKKGMPMRCRMTMTVSVALGLMLDLLLL